RDHVAAVVAKTEIAEIGRSREAHRGVDPQPAVVEPGDVDVPANAILGESFPRLHSRRQEQVHVPAVGPDVPTEASEGAHDSESEADVAVSAEEWKPGELGARRLVIDVARLRARGPGVLRRISGCNSSLREPSHYGKPRQVPGRHRVFHQ